MINEIEIIKEEKPEENDWPRDDRFKYDGWVLSFAFSNNSLKFDKKIELEVKYDVDRWESTIKQGKALLLGLYDGEKWNDLTEKAEKITIIDSNRKWKGSYKVKLKKWDEDPMVAWGP